MSKLAKPRRALKESDPVFRIIVIIDILLIALALGLIGIMAYERLYPW